MLVIRFRFSLYWRCFFFGQPIQSFVEKVSRVQKIFFKKQKKPIALIAHAASIEHKNVLELATVAKISIINPEQRHKAIIIFALEQMPKIVDTLTA